MGQQHQTLVSELQDDDLASDMSAIEKEVQEELAEVIKAAYEQDTEREGREGEAGGRVVLDNLVLTLDNTENNNPSQEDNLMEPTTSAT